MKKAARISAAFCIALLAHAAAQENHGGDFYWEMPARLSNNAGAYPQLIQAGKKIIALWQENITAADASGKAWLWLAAYGTRGLEKHESFAGPFYYTAVGDKAQGNRAISAPVLFSAACNENGSILAVVSSGEKTISVYEASSDTLAFKAASVITLKHAAVAPRVFPRAGGGWHLFVTQSQQFTRKADSGSMSYESLSIFYSRSDDGRTWSDFVPLLSGELGLDPNFLPTAVSADGKDIVVFQSLSGGGRPSYQLYSLTTSDGGQTWSQPVMLSDFDDPARTGSPPGNFDNQRPHMAHIGSVIYISWERKYAGASSQIYAARLDTDGRLIAGSPERITFRKVEHFEPRLFAAGALPYISWCDDRSGKSRLYFARREGKLWLEQNPPIRTRQGLTFGRAAHTERGLFLFWQEGSGTTSSIHVLSPDVSAMPPNVYPVNFTDGAVSNKSYITVRWSEPGDSSGTKGFAYTWSQNAAADPPEAVTVLENVTQASFEADEDGLWYFAIRSVDYAGNWSKPLRVQYTRDTTPPAPPQLLPPDSSQDGFLASNSSVLRWQAPPDTDIAGYSWTMQYLGAVESKPETLAAGEGYALLPRNPRERALWSQARFEEPAAIIRGTQPETKLENIDNGYWAFSVSAVDKVGNISAPARYILRANKFKPYTLVSDIQKLTDESGNTSLAILGRGFMAGGPVTRVYLEKIGADLKKTYQLADNDYSIVSDRVLRIPVLEDLQAGLYRVSLYHPSRGIYYAPHQLNLEYSGTVKFGERGNPWQPQWVFEAPDAKATRRHSALILAAMAVPLLGIIAAAKRLVSIYGEIQASRYEASALLEGRIMITHERKKQTAKRTRRKGLGLTMQFALTISSLVIFVVLLVSIPLGLSVLNTQQIILAHNLEQRVRVLLESAAQSGISYLPAKSTIELSLVLNQIGAIPEAKYMTISAYGGTAANDIVWATNDPDIQEKINTKHFSAGASVLSDDLSDKLSAIIETINIRAQSEIGALAETKQQLQEEGLELAAKLDEKSQTRLKQIAASTYELDKTLREQLFVIADESVSSQPVFDPAGIGTKAADYVFYKPILYQHGRDGIYYRGLVRICVSTETIVGQIKAGTKLLIEIVGIFALIATFVGIFGSFVLSRLIIRPIMRLVRGVETIRDESDKKKLAGFSININRRDELAMLADTINEMAAGLVAAAKEAEFLTVGKEVQKMFIPLITNEHGEKLTTGFDDHATHSFFGYYEGAKGVSGDYFDYRQLDARFWAFIKCDVSGKGVPAALIMVGVATIFTTELNNWNYKRDGIHLDHITYKINDFIEQRGFKGRFAAFIMGIYDAESGTSHLCHAGDNIVRMYSVRERRVVTHTLPSAPTAGTFANELVEMTAPYTQVAIQLEHGDSLLLYTDGFEESSRARRDENFNPLFATKTLRDDEGNENEFKEALVEQLGDERLQQVSEAIMSGGTYTLIKEDDPLGSDMRYEFDFSSIGSGPDALVMGLSAVEKVFRLIPDPSATADDLVLVDARVDEVLSLCWKQYRRFCFDKRPNTDERRKEYVYYGHMKEDEQYDDLTIMLIKRK